MPNGVSVRWLLPLMPQPFFNDHTLYGTVAVMLLPFSFIFAFKGNHWALPKNIKAIFWITTVLILFAVIISFSRGAWIALLGGGVITALLWAGWRFIHFTILLAIISVLIVWQYERFERAFIQVPQVTEYTIAETYRMHDIAESEPEHELQIRVSNQERINRWQAAIGMFREKPFTGFGPGTYQFQYFAYQKHEYKTPISVLVYGPEETGKGGTVHSEYLMALSETGLPGFLAFCVMFLTIFYYISKVYSRSELKSRYFISAVCFGISAFTIHGFLNNFMGTVEAGFLFWFAAGQLLRLAVPFKSHTG
jgi:putative inorganic carbon (hco3(-)) transporter